MHYLISKSKKYVVCQGDQLHCKQYIRNVCDLFGQKESDFVMVKGAKERDRILRSLK